MNRGLAKQTFSILKFLFILLAFPLALKLVSLNADIRKKAGEFPPAVIFVQRNVTSPANEDFALTLLLQGSALQTQKIDAADIIFKYPQDALDLIPTADDKAVALDNNFPTSLDVKINRLQTTKSNENYVILSFQTKLVGGNRLSFSPEKDPITGIPKDIVIGSVRFRPKKIGIVRVEFDTLRTVVAADGINTTNFMANEGDNHDALVKVIDPSYAILRMYPNKVLLDDYNQSVPVIITGKGFISGQTIRIGDTDCTNPSVENETTITCTVPQGIGLGNINVTLVNNQGNTLAVLNEGFAVYETTTPLLSFKVKFFGVNNFKNFENQNLIDLGYREQPLKVKIFGNGKEKIIDNVMVTATKLGENDVVFETKNSETDKIDQRVALVGFPPGIYDLYVKGPKQLQKKFTVQLNGGDNLIDRTLKQSEIMGGDLPLTNGQDGKVNAIDFNYIINHYDSSSSDDLRVADLNLDGGINTGDMSIIAQTLGENQDQDQ